MSIPNQVIVYRYYDPQNKLGMRGICEKYWKGKYFSTFWRRVRDEVKGSKLQVGARSEARGSHQQVNRTTLCM